MVYFDGFRGIWGIFFLAGQGRAKAAFLLCLTQSILGLKGKLFYQLE